MASGRRKDPNSVTGHLRKILEKLEVNQHETWLAEPGQNFDSLKSNFHYIKNEFTPKVFESEFYKEDLLFIIRRTA